MDLGKKEKQEIYYLDIITEDKKIIKIKKNQP